MEISIINYRDNLEKWDLVVSYLKLRKLIFKDQKQWNLVVVEEMEFEQYDTFMTLAHADKSSYIIAHSGTDVLGGGRLIRCDNPNSYMLRDAYFGKLEGLPKELCDKEPPVNDTTWELTRLISKEKSNLASTILSQTNEFLYSKGADKCLTLSHPILGRMGRQLGFTVNPLGPVLGNKDSGKFQAFESLITNPKNLKSDLLKAASRRVR